MVPTIILMGILTMISRPSSAADLGCLSAQSRSDRALVIAMPINQLAIFLGAHRLDNSSETAVYLTVYSIRGVFVAVLWVVGRAAPLI